LGYSSLVLVENVHRRVLLHVVVPVEMVLQFIVRVERGLDVLDGTSETENLVFHCRPGTEKAKGPRGIKRELCRMILCGSV
jgi:hypothetical protein